MFAKNLEIAFAYLCEKVDVSHSLPEEFTARFDALRRYGKLPRGREKRDQLLTSSEIASAILGLAPVHPNWAGHAASILCSLRPIGGADASFFGTSTLQESIAYMLTDTAARNSVVWLSVSAAERGVNSNGYATLSYEIDGIRRRTFYGRAEAVSLMQSGAERDFDPGEPYSPVSRKTVFNRTFFQRLAQEMQNANAFSTPPAGDGSEYDAEEAQQERYRKLGVRRGSRFLNIGVDNQVTWPAKETLTKFDKYHFVLMPKTQDHVQSIHIDLAANQLTDREAITVINRFLSIMTWCDDQFAIAQDGWTGNPVPVPVPKRDLAFTTTYQWIFDRQIPSSEEARRALALYRDGRNAEQNFMISHAVLNFYRIIEIRNNRGEAKNWFREKFQVLRNKSHYIDAFRRFSEICVDEEPHEYLYKACRVAVAHAGKDSKSDPDDANEVTRLHKAAEVLRLLARHFILTELGVSEVLYSAE